MNVEFNKEHDTPERPSQKPTVDPNQENHRGTGPRTPANNR